MMHVGFPNPRWRENVPGIPGACTTHNFTYLVRGPYKVNLVYVFSFLSMVLPKQCKKDVPWTTCLQCTCLQSLYIPHTVTGTRCFIITSKHNGHVLQHLRNMISTLDDMDIIFLVKKWARFGNIGNVWIKLPNVYPNIAWFNPLSRKSIQFILMNICFTKTLSHYFSHKSITLIGTVVIYHQQTINMVHGLLSLLLSI